jgi:PAS domain S-box-containing protein
MAKNPITKSNLPGLRKKAEQKALEQPSQTQQYDRAVMQHELNVHEIELQMQNDELRATQAKLNISCKEYENLFDFSPVGYLILDKKGLIKQLNKMGCTQLGCQKTEVIGMPFSHFIQGESSQDDFYRHRNMVLESKIPCKMECDITKKDGTSLSVLITSIYVGDETNTFKHLLLILNDISEIKAEENKITAALQKERELNALKSRFIRIASHEFRTPLSAILSSNWLIEQYLEEAQVKNLKKHFNRIAHCVEDLTTILNDFLSIEKIESGYITIARSTLNIPDLCHEVIETSAGILGKGQAIEYNHEGPETILEDSAILRHILLNLLSNACKYSGENKKIYLNTEVNNHEFTIKVKDAGIGIPLDEQKNLFVVFFRAQNALNIKGTGLGLHIVKRHAELINGTIEFTSIPNIETVFTVKIPLV